MKQVQVHDEIPKNPAEHAKLSNVWSRVLQICTTSFYESTFLPTHVSRGGSSLGTNSVRHTVRSQIRGLII